MLINEPMKYKIMHQDPACTEANLPAGLLVELPEAVHI